MSGRLLRILSARLIASTTFHARDSNMLTMADNGINCDMIAAAWGKKASVVFAVCS
jgi:hypothetical protein